MPHFLYVEIDGIQRFVFASPKLKNIRGGSAMLDRFNRVEMVSRALQKPGAKKVFVGGGHCLIRGLSKDDAEQIGKDLERELRRLTEGQAALLWAVTPEASNWHRAWEDLKQGLARKRLEPVPASPPLPPFVALCWSCGAAPAQKLVDMQERHPRPHCGACLLRRQEMQAEHKLRKETVWPRLREHLKEFQFQGDDTAFAALLPDGELQALADQSSGSSEYLAYLYCDGNGMGRALSEAPTDAAYGVLSKQIDDSLHQAVAQAIVRHCRPVEISGKRGRFRAEVLLLGGDDLIVALPANCAVDFTVTVLQEFCRANKGAFRLSAGLVFAPPTTPISILQRTADALLRSAKRRAYLDEAREKFKRCAINPPDVAVLDPAETLPPRERAEGYIDFQELASAQTDIEREHSVTCRPYRLDDFLTLVNRTRAVHRSYVPRSKLHALAEAIQGSQREAFTMAQRVIGRAKTDTPHGDQQTALLDLLQPPGVPDSADRLRPFLTWADQDHAAELPFDLYRHPKEHRFSPVLDALELIDHLHLGPTHEDL